MQYRRRLNSADGLRCHCKCVLSKLALLLIVKLLGIIEMIGPLLSKTIGHLISIIRDYCAAVFTVRQELACLLHRTTIF